MILYLVRSAAGGMQRHVLALLNHFGHRHPVGLAIPHGENWAAEVERSFRLPLSAGFSPGRDLLSWRRCYLLLRKVRPALLHIHGFKALYVGVPAARLTGTPVLVTVHNFPAHRGGMILLPPLSRLSGLAGAHYIAVSGALARQLHAWGISEEKVTVIENGIDPIPFEKVFLRRHSGGYFDGELVVGTVARMAPQKGLPYLVEAAGILAARFPGMRFIIAGDGPERYALQKAARRMGLDHRISFPGFCRDLPAILSQIDIFVLPSLAEGFAITLLEAMAAGCAVVATRVGGVPEVVDHGVTGYLVPPASAGALAEAVTILAKDPELRRKVCAGGRDRVRSYFTLERMLKQTEAVYESLTVRSRKTKGRGMGR